MAMVMLMSVVEYNHFFIDKLYRMDSTDICKVCKNVMRKHFDDTLTIKYFCDFCAKDADYSGKLIYNFATNVGTDEKKDIEAAFYDQTISTSNVKCKKCDGILHFIRRDDFSKIYLCRNCKMYFPG